MYTIIIILIHHFLLDTFLTWYQSLLKVFYSIQIQIVEMISIPLCLSSRTKTTINYVNCSYQDPKCGLLYKSNKNEKEKGRLIQNPNYEIPYLPFHTSERTVLIEWETLSHLLRLGEERFPFFRILRGTYFQWRWRGGACSLED